MSDVNTDTGVILEALNDKADRDMNNVAEGIDFVVERYNNGTNWYKLYKSGWVEQGGYVNSIASGTVGVSVVFQKEMADTSYFSVPAWGSADYASLAVGDRATNGMKIFNRTNAANWCYWEVKGMSAQS